MTDNHDGVMFVTGRFGVGGVERATILLANEFVRRGKSVCLVAFEYTDRLLLSTLDPTVEVVSLSFPVLSIKNICILREVVARKKIGLIVNQWALPFHLTMMLRLVAKKTAKILAVHHTMPNRNKRISGSAGLKNSLAIGVTKFSMRVVYRLSDAYVVLSKSYEPIFREFTGLSSAPKLFSIPNPIAAECHPEISKENVILYVGRLSLTDKRVDRVIEVWRRIAEDLPDWRLEIVGDGPDRATLEKAAAGLPRLTFCGFCKPWEYYARSRILLLTSDFEGVPMTVLEAKVCGCVPVVFGSFLTAKDVVGKEDGIVVPAPWDVESFADSVRDLACDLTRLLELSRKGSVGIAALDVKTIANCYMRIFDEGLCDLHRRTMTR